ncbi:MAG: hydroxymethylglutaryl-CoA synthase [Candidatus Bathyarchaeia archaeon]
MFRTHARMGIEGFGAYLPKYRIRIRDLPLAHGAPSPDFEKAICGPDEDAVTMAKEAIERALKMAGVGRDRIGSILCGTSSNPYWGKPIGTILSKALGMEGGILAADINFSGKSCSEALQLCIGLVGSGMMDYAIAAGSDSIPPGPLGESAAYSSCGAAAFVVGRETGSSIASIEGSSTWVVDALDVWSMRGSAQRRNSGRFAERVLAQCVTASVEDLLSGLGLRPGDFDHVVLPQSDPKSASGLAKRLGFKPEQMEAGFVLPKAGNVEALSGLLGLIAVLDVAKPSERILVATFGIGAGSDYFSLLVKDAIEGRERGDFLNQVSRKAYIDYKAYSRSRRNWGGSA